MKGLNANVKIFILVMCVFTVSIPTGCSAVKTTAVAASAGKPEKLYVFAASSLTESFTLLAQEFEKQQDGNIDIVFNFAGSQALRATIEAGAKADIFASADMKNMEKLEKADFVTKHKIFAKNRLALAVYTGSKYKVEKMADLGTPGMKLAVADSSVPVGAYWAEALKDALTVNVITGAGQDAINANISTKELNVKDVLSKVLLGEADAGVVYGTDLAGADKDKVREVNIPAISRFTASYPAAMLKASEKKKSAVEFYSYLFSEPAKDIFEECGFLTGVENEK